MGGDSRRDLGKKIVAMAVEGGNGEFFELGNGMVEENEMKEESDEADASKEWPILAGTAVHSQEGHNALTTQFQVGIVGLTLRGHRIRDAHAACARPGLTPV